MPLFYPPVGENPSFNSINIGGVSLYLSSNNPNGNIHGNTGDLCLLSSGGSYLGLWFVCEGGTVWSNMFGLNGTVFEINRPLASVIEVITTPAVPTSGTAETNSNSYDVIVDVGGGVITDITINSQSLGVAGGSFILRNGDSITLTYTSAPTWTWRNL